MKHQKSKIGEYGIRLIPIEGYLRKDGKKIPPHYKKIKFNWKNN
jgi:hypothetical protein